MLYHQWLGTKKRIDFCGGVQVLDCHCAAAPRRLAMFVAATMVWSMALLQPYCLAIIDLNVLFYLLFLSFGPPPCQIKNNLPFFVE